MNGNGSSDIVWADSEGNVDYLELFPVRPNLLSRIENGIGKVTDITYGTGVAQLVLDGGPGAWSSPLPHPMQVVTSKDDYDLLTDLHEVTTYRYHDGFYDGDEKQFRGFARVEMTLIGDDTQEPGLTDMYYDVGKSDPFFNGKLLRQVQFSGDRELSDTVTTWEDCPVAEVEGTTGNPVRYICETGTTTLLKEGLAEPQWVKTVTASNYDGYGNVTLSSDLGVTEVGGGGCEPCGGRDPEVFGAPCGAQCVGDERFEETDYIAPGADTNQRWILHAAAEERMYGRPGSAQVKVTRHYYDGADFVGMDLGKLDQGKATRMTEQREVGSDEVVQVTRSRFDVHGNVIERIDPNGDPGVREHRRLYSFEEDGLRIVEANVLLDDKNGEPYALRRTMTYDPIFDKVEEGTAWLRVVNDQIVSTRRSSYFLYDEFGRMIRRVLPGGDTAQSPTETYMYDLGAQSSRLVTQRRSTPGEPSDIKRVDCMDGRGRTYQTRTQLDGDTFQVTGFTSFNVRSQPVAVAQPFTSPDDPCSLAPPTGVKVAHTAYDATGREVSSTVPDESLYGTSSTTRTTYGPLTTTVHDPEDADAAGPYADTPTVTHTNGLGQTVAIDRYLTPTAFERITLTYDSLGRLRGTIDADGNEKVQEYDLLDRVTRIVDPNTRGESTFAWDDAGNLTAMTDDRGITTRSAYDGMNRLIKKWDDADEAGTLITWTWDHDDDCDPTLCSNTEGRAVSVTWPGPGGVLASDRMGYDLRERAIYRARTLMGHTFEQRTTWDNADRVLSVTHPDGTVLTNTWDDASRLTSIQGLVETIGYDERSLLASAAFADGSAMAMGYDDILRPASLSITGDGGTDLQAWSYSRDRVGNLIAVDDLVPTGPAFSDTFTYDAWYRVTAADLAAASPTAETVTFGFDAIDNLLSRTSSTASSRENVGAYAYGDLPNAATAAGAMTFAYDDAGYMTARNGVLMTWDFMGRMTSAGDAAFSYGANQSRVARTEGDQVTLYVAPTFEVRDGITSLYVKVAGKRVARIESAALATDLMGDPVPDGQVNAADALAADDAQLLWTSVRRLLLETGPEGGTTFLHSDHLGNLTLATGTVGGELAVLGERAYYPTGQERPDAWGYVDEYGFTGQELDRSTGLIHFDWRYLDPVTGRWLSVDPSFATLTDGNVGQLGESTTAYNYVAGNFANLVDPTGLGIGSYLKGKAASAATGLGKRGGTSGGKLSVRGKLHAWGSKVKTARATKARQKAIISGTLPLSAAAKKEESQLHADRQSAMKSRLEKLGSSAAALSSSANPLDRLAAMEAHGVDLRRSDSLESSGSSRASEATITGALSGHTESLSSVAERMGVDPGHPSLQDFDDD